ncbi:MAG: ABC transporter permease [Cyanobacteria bacterium J06597_1]
MNPLIGVKTLAGLNRAVIYRIGAVGLALMVTAILLWAIGASPMEVATRLWQGAFGTEARVARLLMTLAPLVLASAGLAFTFAAGLYNLGVEGQIAMGAISTTLALRLFESVLPAPVTIGLGLVFGLMGGAMWGLLVGWLNVFGKVNEIFAGLGLNFVAQGLAIYLIFGPWKRPGVASLSGTEPFARQLWLPTAAGSDASWIALAIAAVALVFTIVTLRGTYFGLKLRAVGNNLRASYVLGIPAVRQRLSAFGLCGALAGVAGALQILAVFHRLIPNISSNLGFLGLLVVMLAGFDALWILPIALFFSALNVGSLQLPLTLDLDSSLAGVIQGCLVLFILLGRGVAERGVLRGKRTARSR